MLNRHRLFLSLVAVSLFNAGLVGCAGGHNPDREQPVEKPDVTTSVSGVEFGFLANGLYALTPLEKVESGQHYDLVFELVPGGSLTLMSHAILDASSKNLSRGVELMFSRSTDAGDSKVKVVFRASGGEQDWSAAFESLDVRETLRIGVDVHNDEPNEAHVLVWAAGDAPVVNSAAPSIGGTKGRGFGARWGLLLSQANIKSIRLEAPRDDHDVEAPHDHGHGHDHENHKH